MSGRAWLVMIAFSIALLLSALWIHRVRAHDHAQPANNDWLQSLTSKGKVSCCDGNDTDALDDWEAAGDRYREKFRGQWFDVPDEAVVDGPNKSGGALLWMNKGWGGLSIRCFMPGSMT